MKKSISKTPFNRHGVSLSYIPGKTTPEDLRISNYKYIASKMVSKARNMSGPGEAGLKWLRKELKKAPGQFREFFKSRFAF